MEIGDYIGPDTDPQVRGYPPEVAQALADAYAAGFWDGVEAVRDASVALHPDYRKRGAMAGAHALRDANAR